ncbi:alpha/beta hydrolase [Dehalococcoidia bacterium]|nr:alpha/beta hydrolase [Dehalococcoidia bacterium]
MEIQFVADGFSLEGELLLPLSDSHCSGVVICHPHPQYGGDMHNNVVQTVRNSLIQKGIAVLTFNFRGVGNSEGTYSGGEGEGKDAVAALDYLKTVDQVTDRPIGLCGYSFGAHVASSVAMQYPGLTALGLISGVVESEWINLPSIPKLIISGDRDEYVSNKDVESLETNLPHPREIIMVPGVDHFWSPGEDVLDMHIGNFFEKELSVS